MVLLLRFYANYRERCEDMMKAIWKKIIKYIYDKCLEIVLDDDYERDYDRNYSKYLRYYRKRGSIPKFV